MQIRITTTVEVGEPFTEFFDEEGRDAIRQDVTRFMRANPFFDTVEEVKVEVVEAVEA